MLFSSETHIAVPNINSTTLLRYSFKAIYWFLILSQFASKIYIKGYSYLLLRFFGVGNQ